MKKAIIVFCMTVSALCFYSLATAMPFTVDERSPLHAGAGLVLGYPLGIIAASSQQTNNLTDTEAVLIAGTVAITPLVLKEFLYDGHPDAGDLLFDLTAYAGAYLGVKTGHYFFVSQKEDTPVLNYIVRY